MKKVLIVFALFLFVGSVSLPAIGANFNRIEITSPDDPEKKCDKDKEEKKCTKSEDEQKKCTKEQQKKCKKEKKECPKKSEE